MDAATWVTKTTILTSISSSGRKSSLIVLAWKLPSSNKSWNCVRNRCPKGKNFGNALAKLKLLRLFYILRRGGSAVLKSCAIDFRVSPSCITAHLCDTVHAVRDAMWVLGYGVSDLSQIWLSVSYFVRKFRITIRCCYSFLLVCSCLVLAFVIFTAVQKFVFLRFSYLYGYHRSINEEAPFFRFLMLRCPCIFRRF